MSNITEILEEAKSVKPISEENGTKVYGFDDYIKAVKGELTDPTPDLGTRKVDEQGKILRSRVVVACTNENVLYGNLGYAKKNPQELLLAPQAVPEDYEFVANQNYTPHKVKVFVFRKDKDTKKMYLDRTELMDGAEARQKLVHIYNEDLMKSCLELIASKGQEVTKEDSPFE